MRAKREAYIFLEKLGEFLNSRLPPPALMRSRIDAIVREAQECPDSRHLRTAETAFLNQFTTPLIHEVLSVFPGMTAETARDSLLSESYRALAEFCSGTPARRLRHPFNKALNVTAPKVYAQWSLDDQTVALTQSCPDFAIRAPFPHKIVFEGKYFRRGGLGAARTALVTNAYQAFFYRALPPDNAAVNRPPWDYDYSCLLAYDATDEGTFVKAWQSLSPAVRAGFWEGASVYIMVLRGNEI
jgi:hypothetical protein